MVRFISSLACSFLVGACWSSDALGQDPADSSLPTTPETEREPPEFALWLGHVESDNVGRTQDKERGSYDALGLLFGYERNTDRLEADFNADLETRRYAENVLEDEVVGNLDALADIDLIRDRFLWHFQENYDQGRNDPFTAAGPTNRESVNVFASGPQFILPLGGRTRLSASGDYSVRRYEESTVYDGDATIYELGVFRNINRTTEVGIIASSDEIDYEDVGVASYETTRLAARYERELATGSVLVDVGTNELNVEGVKESEPLYAFEWSRGLSARSDLSVTAAREFTDTGTLFGRQVSDSANAGSDVLLSSSPLQQKRVDVVYAFAAPRTQVTLGLGASNDSYVGDQTLDNDATSARLALNRLLSPRMSLGLSFDEVQREFAIGSPALQEDSDSTLSAWLNRSIGRLFDVALVATRYKRDGTQSFEEDRFEIRFNYSPGDTATTALRSVGR